MVKKKFRVIIDGEVYDVEVEIEEGMSPVQTLVSTLQTGTIRRVEPVVPTKGAVVAPITGRLVEIKVNKGDKVQKNDVVAILEAMKTQVEVKAGIDGVVEEVLTQPGTSIRQGQPILRIKEK